MPDVNLHGPPYKQVPTVTAVNVLHKLPAFHKLSQCSEMSRMLYKVFLVTVQDQLFCDFKALSRAVD